MKTNTDDIYMVKGAGGRGASLQTEGLINFPSDESFWLETWSQGI